MEYHPHYQPNPYERDEAPRCPECDQQMTEVTGLFMPSYWECRNPECECCPQKYQSVTVDEDKVISPYTCSGCGLTTWSMFDLKDKPHINCGMEYGYWFAIPNGGSV